MTPPIPPVGLGTWPLLGGEGERVVSMGLELGYRHIDTAQMYGNEAEVGRAIRASGIPRDEIFLVTKVHPDRFGEGRVMASCEDSLALLDTDHVDMLLVHWPPRGIDTKWVIDDMQTVREAGLTRAIGVSNFNRPQFRAAAERAEIATNQVEFHALIDQAPMLALSRELGVPLTAYMPVARGRVMDEPVVQAIAAGIGRTPAQVALRWIVQQGVIAIPMSTRRENLAANLAVTEFSLSARDMGAISALTTRHQRFCRQADWEPDWEA